MKIKELLQKYNKLTKEINTVDYHLQILHKEVDDVLAILSKKGIIDIKNYKTEEDFALLFVDLIEKSSHSNKKFDDSIYIEIIRIGTGASKFPGGHNHNKWNNGAFEDDGFGFGTTNTDLYDDYNDNYNYKKRL